MGILSGRRRKLFAIIAVALLLALVFFVMNRHYMPDFGGPGEEEPSYDLVPPNYPVTTKDSDNNEPSIAINPNNPLNMVAGSNDYNTPQGDAWPGFYTTFDGGETWSEELIDGYPGGPVSQLTGFRGGGDPVLVAADGDIFYFAGIAFKRTVNPFNPIGFGINLGIANCVFVARSTNGGQTFDQVVIVWAALQNLVRFNDKEWVAVDPNDSSKVYLVWAIFTGMMTARLLFSRSMDGGASWSAPYTITETSGGELNIQGSAIVVDEEGTIHVTWIDFNRNQVRYASSTDNGQSFSSPADVSDVTPIPRYLPNGNYRTPCMTMLAVDMTEGNTTGNLYVTWADIREGDSDVMLAYSHDRGASWGGPVRVNNDNASNGIDQFFPAVAVSEEGWVHVGFYDRRSDQNNTLLEYWWAVSFDAGLTFPWNTPMSNESFNGDYSRDNDNDFIGDYTGIVAMNSTVAAVWCDTREGSETDADTEIYAAIFNYKQLIWDNRDVVDYPIPFPEKDYGHDGVAGQ